VADLTELPFENNQFDYIICNHILEHIPDDQKALNEIFRCLKVGGHLVITVPWCIDEKTYNNSKVTTDDERILYFGQRDHVRLYGNDFREILQNSGFNVKMYCNSEVFSKEEIETRRYIADDIVWICEK
jgi:predicted SAM-dependent methyltransferase